MDKVEQIKSAWNSLMGLDKRHYVPSGFYALGDAYLLSGKDPVYKGKVILVEHRNKTQFNHWDWTILRTECRQQPTITTNGDDGNGNLKRKAPSLKVYS